MRMPSLHREVLDRPIRQLHKIVHGQSALKLSDITATSISSLRSAGQSLHYSTAHTSVRNNFFSYRTVRQWNRLNSLPDSTLRQGRFAMKRHLDAITNTLQS